MLVDLIKRMVITEKYVYRDPNEQENLEMKLEKFKETQEKQQQEQREKETEEENQKNEDFNFEKEKSKAKEKSEENKNKNKNDEDFEKETNEIETSLISTNEINNEEKNNEEKSVENKLNDNQIENENQLSKPLVKKVKYPTYTFDLDVRLNKPQIKALFEKVFNVNVVSVNTYIAPMKKKRVGFNQGYKPRYKRAIIKLKPNQKIDNPLDKTIVNENISTD